MLIINTRVLTDLGLVLVVESLLHLGVPVDGHIRLSCRHTEADLESVTFINTALRTIQMSLQQGQNNEECVGERFTKFVKFLLLSYRSTEGEIYSVCSTLFSFRVWWEKCFQNNLSTFLNSWRFRRFFSWKTEMYLWKKKMFLCIFRILHFAFHACNPENKKTEKKVKGNNFISCKKTSTHPDLLLRLENFHNTFSEL